ncbi:DUF3306 domain-containing protein [Halomonas sp. ML-15]|uniref:DUF3306 domain-containing protein n=1 Tax=Halomonas sp. ML-15 TaxID=2773305 RepID=UPI0017474BCF|nr:DUF3306 domain-containing protein [Halomonas sp. ML-15]MBD3894392.1 DUF3306 domain-containing protein [Halomonas sp. ML-15]
MNRFELWSRRKRGLPVEQPESEDAPLSESPRQAVETSEAAAHSAPTAHSSAQDAPDEATASPVAPPAEGSLDDSLPDPDTLGPGSDFKAYLVPGVSSALKNRALRRLWATGNYNVRDGLDDYDLDYSQMRKMTTETSETVRQWGKKLLDKLEEPDEASADSPISSASAHSEEDTQGDDAAANPAPSRQQDSSVEPPPEGER